MLLKSPIHLLTLCCGVGVIYLSGCSNLNHTQNGALVGTGLGAATGAVIGHQSGNRDAGALIGAAAGALGGAVIGHEQQMEEERDAAMSAAQHAEWQRHAAAQAVTNQDIIRMTQGGLSDGVIVNAIHTRGGRFEMSPDSLIALKAEGVGNDVIQAMQNGTSPGVTTIAGSTTLMPTNPSGVVAVSPSPTVVYVTPRPTARIVIGPSRVVVRPRGHRHRPHGHHHW